MFEEELTLIKNDEIREITARLLDGAPEYFWHVAASSSGKYHPAYALGEGGLVRHVKAAVRFANHLFVINDFTEKEQDYIISALLLHDILKHGKDGDVGHTVFEHPILGRICGSGFFPCVDPHGTMDHIQIFVRRASGTRNKTSKIRT